jgi:hypothetical protein
VIEVPFSCTYIQLKRAAEKSLRCQLSELYYCTGSPEGGFSIEDDVEVEHFFSLAKKEASTKAPILECTPVQDVATSAPPQREPASSAAASPVASKRPDERIDHPQPRQPYYIPVQPTVAKTAYSAEPINGVVMGQSGHCTLCLRPLSAAIGAWRFIRQPGSPGFPLANACTRCTEVILNSHSQ